MNGFKWGNHKTFVGCRVEDGPTSGQAGGRGHGKGRLCYTSSETMGVWVRQGVVGIGKKG